jgi:hypothetical protein
MLFGSIILDLFNREGIRMCLICVEYNKKKMTREEMLRALPEMIMFANNDKDREHFERLKKLDGNDLDDEIQSHLNAQIKKTK